MVDLLGKVKSLAHPLINVWQEDDGVVIFEVTSIWRFHDDTEVTINACSIFTIADGKFTDQRIYVDNAHDPDPDTRWLGAGSSGSGGGSSTALELGVGPLAGFALAGVRGVDLALLQKRGLISEGRRSRSCG